MLNYETVLGCNFIFFFFFFIVIHWNPLDIWRPFIAVFLNYMGSVNCRFPEVVSRWLLLEQAWLYLAGKMQRELFWMTCTFLTLKPWPGMKLMQCKIIENIPAYSFLQGRCTFLSRLHFYWVGTSNHIWLNLFIFVLYPKSWKYLEIMEDFGIFWILISSNRMKYSFCWGHLLIQFFFFFFCNCWHSFILLDWGPLL